MYITAQYKLPEEYKNVQSDICKSLNGPQRIVVQMEGPNNVDSLIQLDRIAGEVVPGSAKIENDIITYQIKIFEDVPYGKIVKSLIEDGATHNTRVSTAALGKIDEDTGMIQEEDFELSHAYIDRGENNFKLNNKGDD